MLVAGPGRASRVIRESAGRGLDSGGGEDQVVGCVAPLVAAGGAGHQLARGFGVDEERGETAEAASMQTTRWRLALAEPAKGFIISPS